eukprot:CAMPEP_0118663044 /NCGR_PEP_ID=MMETSP0785-20121206/17178_1 /TAXON_ID=91992 /ORGANISM="Bolidomonas pacifica, Strain CCMP 1866" /LENGTH=47 /DNA_ID= /DNA_START= /DNA_END= /DNA_ORIENTATION=
MAANMPAFLQSLILPSSPLIPLTQIPLASLQTLARTDEFIPGITTAS